MNWIKKGRCIALALVFSAANAYADQCPSTISSWTGTAPLPVLSARGYRGVVLPPEASKAILCPCSRSTPGLGKSYFHPSSAQVAELESKLSEFMRTQSDRRAPNQWERLPSFVRQYLGVVRGGRSFIYINLSPPDDKNYWRSRAVVMCDGGPDYFGVEYDVSGRKFHHIAFNGTL